MIPAASALLIVGAVTLAGLVQGLTGFGFGLVSMALLPLLMNFKDALVIVALLNLAACAATLASTFRHFRWRDGAGLVIGSALGVPLGFYALVRLESDWLLHGLGAVMCLFSASELFLARRWPLRFPPSAGLPVGLISGSLGGAFNIGGPPVIAYAYSQPWPPQRIVAVLQVVFGVSALLRLYLVHDTGLLRADLARLALWSLPPMLLAILLGNRLLIRLPRQQMRSGVFVFLFTLGVKYLLFK